MNYIIAMNFLAAIFRTLHDDTQELQRKMDEASDAMKEEEEDKAELFYRKLKQNGQGLHKSLYDVVHTFD